MAEHNPLGFGVVDPAIATAGTGLDFLKKCSSGARHARSLLAVQLIDLVARFVDPCALQRDGREDASIVEFTAVGEGTVDRMLAVGVKGALLQELGKV